MDGWVDGWMIRMGRRAYARVDDADNGRERVRGCVAIRTYVRVFVRSYIRVFVRRRCVIT